MKSGFSSNLAVFFSSLLPQFVAHGQATFAHLLILGLLFNAMTLAWLTAYALVDGRVGDVLRRDRIRRSMEGITGLVLVGVEAGGATSRG